MKLRAFCLAVGLLAVSSLSYGQGFSALLYYLGDGTTGLTQSCTGGPGIPDAAGCNGVIYWAGNNQPAPVGDGFLQANFNTFAINGEATLGIVGGFYTDPLFTISTGMPNPATYWVVVECGNVRWTSAPFTIPGAGLHDIEVGGWQCETLTPPCDEPTQYDITVVGGRDFFPYYQCLYLCAGAVTTVCVGPLAANARPHALVIPGCLPPSPCNDECPPAQFGYDDNAWTYNAATGQWCNVIVPQSDGCVCLCIEYVEDAEYGNFSAVARSGSVELTWTTLSESGLSQFEVKRDGNPVGTVLATNTATGATYTFVDSDLVNGTTYSYTLDVVNTNGSREAWGVTVNATPSLNAALITEYALHQNYPNPFNPSTNLVYDVVDDNVVTLTVYNAMGQEIKTLVSGLQGSGRHTVSFDATNLTSGLYFYTVKIGNEFTATKKMLLVK